jgi:hypothetical protein
MTLSWLCALLAIIQGFVLVAAFAAWIYASKEHVTGR